jgi:3-deoxy-D-manno-octulosonic-acid transferase
VTNFADVYQELDVAGGATQVESGGMLARQVARLLNDPAARLNSLGAAEAVVARLGGALERTLAVLEPYLLQLRIEGGAANA